MIRLTTSDCGGDLEEARQIPLRPYCPLGKFPRAETDVVVEQDNKWRYLWIDEAGQTAATLSSVANEHPGQTCQKYVRVTIRPYSLWPQSRNREMTEALADGD